VQSRCDLGLQSHLGGCSIACDQPDEPAVSRIVLGLTVAARSPIAAAMTATVALFYDAKLNVAVMAYVVAAPQNRWQGALTSALASPREEHDANGNPEQPENKVE